MKNKKAFLLIGLLLLLHISVFCGKILDSIQGEWFLAPNENSLFGTKLEIVGDKCILYANFNMRIVYDIQEVKNKLFLSYKGEQTTLEIIDENTIGLNLLTIIKYVRSNKKAPNGESGNKGQSSSLSEQLKKQNKLYNQAMREEVAKMPIKNDDGINISDYYPIKLSSSSIFKYNDFKYKYKGGIFVDVVIDSFLDKKDNTISYTLLRIHMLNNEILGSYILNLKTKDNKGFINDKLAIAPPNNQWTLTFKGEEKSWTEKWKTSKASIEFDGKTFPDCILVEEQSKYGIIKKYYAKGVGLVYSILVDPDDPNKKTMVKKLISSSLLEETK